VSGKRDWNPAKKLGNSEKSPHTGKSSATNDPKIPGPFFFPKSFEARDTLLGGNLTRQVIL
jgi:hypothetical protein